MNLTTSSSSPFGMQMQNRTWEALENGYRFGFNGKERDDEVSGYDLGLRFYNPSLARMLRIDPRFKEYVWQSGYVYHRNSPISIFDYFGGGDPPDVNTMPSAVAINNLLDKSDQEYNLAAQKDELAKQKIKEAITLLDQASTVLEEDPQSEDNILEAARLSLIASQKVDEASNLWKQADLHQTNGQDYLDQAQALVPQLMEEYYAELDKLNDWKEDAKMQAVVDIIDDELFGGLFRDAAAISLFGNNIAKSGALGSGSTTSLWSKYVASKYQVNSPIRLPSPGGAKTTNATRWGGRIAIPLLLVWESYRTVENIQDLYRLYTDGPTEEEIQAILDDFEEWKKEQQE